jgi:site-specific recombinase XerD
LARPAQTSGTVTTERRNVLICRDLGHKVHSIGGWCRDRALAPLTTQRNDLKLYARWMQEVRRLKPSTVSRRMSVVACCYRTCVIDGLLEHSPAEHVRRPRVPPESPTLGLTHLQFETSTTSADTRTTSSPPTWHPAPDAPLPMSVR